MTLYSQLALPNCVRKPVQSYDLIKAFLMATKYRNKLCIQCIYIYISISGNKTTWFCILRQGWLAPCLARTSSRNLTWRVHPSPRANFFKVESCRDLVTPSLTQIIARFESGNELKVNYTAYKSDCWNFELLWCDIRRKLASILHLMLHSELRKA